VFFSEQHQSSSVFCPCHKLSHQWIVNAFATYGGVWGSLKIWKSLAWIMFFKKIKLYALFFSFICFCCHSSYHVYICALFILCLCIIHIIFMGSSSVYATTFNNFDFLAFDDLNLSIVIFNDLDLLVLNNLQFLLCMIKFQMLRLCIWNPTTHFFVIETHFAIATNFTEVQVMQLATIQVQVQVWESHS
jgi:hypothetical protein